MEAAFVTLHAVVEAGTDDRAGGYGQVDGGTWLHLAADVTTLR
jgi:hypothetical protein